MKEAEARQIRARYGAKLTMIDHWLGKVLDTIDEKKLWDDTVASFQTVGAISLYRWVACGDHKLLYMTQSKVLEQISAEVPKASPPG